MAWIMLGIAGLLEVGWSIGLKYSHGFTRPLPSVLTALGIAGSMLLLSLAARTLPIGTAYGVWVGIGAVGSAILGIVLLGEAVTVGRIFFLCLMVIAIVGLKLTGSH
ncbi:quaternary ammonium compound efflux SMR transporter SugE [Embleya sp. AB8]|uniref:quaternary ammonium compound efflux SMR transporter SugE n=1 Tax=Embleya sp. AB8 TaxID=3156304 RepID=UPI003C73CE1A